MLPSGEFLKPTTEEKPGHPLPRRLVGDVPGADAVVGDQPVDVLRRQRVQRFGGDRHAERGDAAHEHPGGDQPDADPVGAVEVRVVGEALPVDLGPRLLGVGAHDDLEVVAVPVAHPARGSPAYSSVAAGSWIEHGPAMTASRSSAPPTTSVTARRPARVVATDAAGQRDDGGDRLRGDDDAEPGDPRVDQAGRGRPARTSARPSCRRTAGSSSVCVASIRCVHPASARRAAGRRSAWPRPGSGRGQRCAPPCSRVLQVLDGAGPQRRPTRTASSSPRPAPTADRPGLVA